MDLCHASRKELADMPYTLVERAMEEGNIEAIGILGVFYFNGINGAPVDYQKAKLLFEFCYQKLEDNNVSYFLGTIYENGLGTEPNFQKAIKFYRIYSEICGNPMGYASIGMMYVKGEIVEKNDDIATTYFIKSDKMGGCPLSDTFVGLFYAAGLNGYEKNINKAVFHYERSKSFKQLGDLFSDGKYVKENFQLANHYYELGMNDNENCLFTYAFMNTSNQFAGEPWRNEAKGIESSKKALEKVSGMTNYDDVSLMIINSMRECFSKNNSISGLKYLFSIKNNLAQLKCEPENKINVFYSIVYSLVDNCLNNMKDLDKELSYIEDQLSEFRDTYPEFYDVVHYLYGFISYRVGEILLSIKNFEDAYDMFVTANKIGYEDAQKHLVRFKRDFLGRLRYQ